MNISYLSLSMFPRPIDEIHRKTFNAQPSLDPIHHYLQAFAVSDYKARVVQFICHLFEVEIGILGYRLKINK